MHEIFSFFCFILCWIYSFIIAFIAIPLFWISPALGQTCQRLFGSVNLLMMDIEVTYRGLENVKLEQGAILAPNHESIFDILVIAALPFQKAWLAKKEIRYIPFIGQVMQAMGSHFVTRNKSERDIRILGEIEKALQNGKKIVIFPEGTRTRNGQLQPFKRGAFRTALNAGVPLIPIAITGTFEIAPPGHLPTRSHSVIVRMGTPLVPSKEDSVETLMERYRTALVGLLTLDRS